MSSSSLSRCALVGALCAFAAAAQANSYTVVDLGADRYPVQVNSHGWIAGQHPHGASQSAIVYRGAHWHRLTAAGEDGYALAINATGDVVGIGGAGGVATIWPRGGGR